MKNLYKMISPFSPDQSGAVSVLYELGGVVAVLDAGGCAGNICGFDEPRWMTKKSAVFSAGLRDMDAIMGRDELLAEKLKAACEKIDPEFCAVVGTPAPAIIGTDFDSLRQMIEEMTGKKTVCVETTGTKYFDSGEEKAYLDLFKTFAEKKFDAVEGKTGVVGVTPLEFSCLDADKKIRNVKGFENAVCFGYNSGLDEIVKASECEKLVAASPSAVKACEYLSAKFDIPYEKDRIYIPEKIKNKCENIKDKKVLVITGQFIFEKLKDILNKNNNEVTFASFFMTKGKTDYDIIKLSDEDSLTELISSSEFDEVIGDAAFEKINRKFALNKTSEFTDFPSFSVSGRLTD